MCDSKDFVILAGKILRDYLYPLHLKFPDESDSKFSTERWFRQIVINEINDFLREKGFNLNEIIMPLSSISDQAKYVCPRCLSEYSSFAEMCPDCGVRLLDIDGV